MEWESWRHSTILQRFEMMCVCVWGCWGGGGGGRVGYGDG